jgi:hypothetical protein
VILIHPIYSIFSLVATEMVTEAVTGMVAVAAVASRARNVNGRAHNSQVWLQVVLFPAPLH